LLRASGNGKGGDNTGVLQHKNVLVVPLRPYGEGESDYAKRVHTTRG
jgi:hypothetical protein